MNSANILTLTKKQYISNAYDNSIMQQCSKVNGVYKKKLKEPNTHLRQTLPKAQSPHRPVDVKTDRKSRKDGKSGKVSFVLSAQAKR